jgi:hypothetical protein
VSTGLRKQVAEAIYTTPLPLRRHLMYLSFCKSWGDFRNPRSFNEKLNWRIVNDRRPLLAWTCDKLAVKDHVAEHVESPKTYWSGTDVRELADLDLPKRWVLKPNHRSRLVHYGTGPAGDVDALARKTSDWLVDLQGAKKGEWAYTQARHVFLVEEMLGTQEHPPVDYRFFVFDGQPRYVQVLYDVNRLHGVPTRRYYGAEDWKPLQLRQGIVGLAPIVPMPRRYDEMFGIAATVGAPFDFVRVDLYNVDGGIRLGEVTIYPGGGLVPFEPPEFDLEFGDAWTLPLLDASGREAAAPTPPTQRPALSDEARRPRTSS